MIKELLELGLSRILAIVLAAFYTVLLLHYPMPTSVVFP